MASSDQSWGNGSNLQVMVDIPTALARNYWVEQPHGRVSVPKVNAEGKMHATERSAAST